MKFVYGYLIKTHDDKDERWYSEEYLRKQIEIAYNAGISKGIKVQFHAATPTHEDHLDGIISEFNRRRSEAYQKAYSQGEVWRIANQQD